VFSKCLVLVEVPVEIVAVVAWVGACFYVSSRDRILRLQLLQ